MQDTNPGLTDYVSVVWKFRKRAAWNLIAIVALGVLISVLLPSWYEARSSLLPPDESSEVSFFLPMSPSPSFLPFSIPGLASPSDLFAAILESNTLMEEIVDRFDLQRVYKVKKKSDAIRKLRKHSEMDVTDEGIVVVKVEDKDPERAARMAESFVEILDEFNREKRMTQGKRVRIFVEEQLREAEGALAGSEESLREFQEAHSTVELTEQTKAAIEAAADLAGQMAALEVRENLLLNFLTPSHPELVRVRTERQEVAEQIRQISAGSGAEDKERFYVPLSELPAVGVELARLTREVRIRSEVYGVLVDIYQRAKIQEAKDTPTVQILDEAAPPDRRIRPRRTLIVLLAAVVGLGGSLAIAFLSNWLETAGAAGDPLAESWNDLIERLRR